MAIYIAPTLRLTFLENTHKAQILKLTVQPVLGLHLSFKCVLVR